MYYLLSRSFTVSLLAVSLQLFPVMGNAAKPATRDSVALVVEKSTQLKLLDLGSKAHWRWLENQGIVTNDQAGKSLAFQSSQRGSGFSVSFKTAAYRKRWLAINVEFQSDRRGWVGLRYFLVKNDGKKFFDPAVALPHCKPADKNGTMCEIFGYVPDGAKSVTVDVVGFHANFKVRRFSINVALSSQETQEVAKARALFDNGFNLMKRRFFRTSEVDWSTLSTEGHTWVSDSPSTLSWVSSLAWVASELPSDGHTHVKASIAKGNQTAKSLDASRHPQNVVTRLNDAIAYVKLTATTDSTEDQQSYSDGTQRQILDLLQVGVSSWIVDLRGNHGGSIYAMLNAVSPLLGTGRFSYFEFSDGSRSALGMSRDGAYISKVNDFESKTVVIHLTTDLPASKPPLKIFVIVDRTCASACEALTIAMKDLPSVEIIGQPTAGLATGNSSYPLGTNFKLILTESYLLDAQGNRIYPRIQPTTILTLPEERWMAEVKAKLDSVDISRHH